MPQKDDSVRGLQGPLSGGAALQSESRRRDGTSWLANGRIADARHPRPDPAATVTVGLGAAPVAVSP